MSEGPEECVFCRIVANGGQPMVLERPDAVAFMDLRQPREGHVLVVPRRHVQQVFDLDFETGAALMAAVVEVARAVRRAFRPDGLSVWQSNGPGAHQEVPHLHIHVVPRFEGDGLLRVYPEPPNSPDAGELERQAALIRAAM